MLEQQRETLEESWNNIFTVFYTYYGSRNEELKADAGKIYEVIFFRTELLGGQCTKKGRQVTNTRHERLQLVCRL